MRGKWFYRDEPCYGSSSCRITDRVDFETVAIIVNVENEAFLSEILADMQHVR